MDIGRKIQTLYIAGVILSLAGCASDPVILEYQRTSGKVAGAGEDIVFLGMILDERGKPSKWLGSSEAIALTTVETSLPVRKMLSNAFGFGLRDRKLAAHRLDAAYELSGSLRKFQVNQRKLNLVPLGSMQGEAEIEFKLSSRGAKEPLLVKTYRVEKSAEKGGVEEMRVLASQMLQELVPMVLDDPELRTHIKAKEKAQLPDILVNEPEQRSAPILSTELPPLPPSASF